MRQTGLDVARVFCEDTRSSHVHSAFRILPLAEKLVYDMVTSAHCNRCDAVNDDTDPYVEWACRNCGHEHEPDEKLIVVKGGMRLSVAEAKTALEQAMEIIEAVGTTGIYSRTQSAQAWMKRYFPNWA